MRVSFALDRKYLSFKEHADDDMDPEVPVVDHLPRRMDEREELDVNIWNEQADTKRNIHAIKDENGNVSIRAATLNKLVQFLTAEKEKNIAAGKLLLKIV
jgi:hypothetical protein